MGYDKSYIKFHFVKLIASALSKAPCTLPMMGINITKMCRGCVLYTQVKVSIYIRSFEASNLYRSFFFLRIEQEQKEKGVNNIYRVVTHM